MPPVPGAPRTSLDSPLHSVGVDVMGDNGGLNGNLRRRRHGVGGDRDDTIVLLSSLPHDDPSGGGAVEPLMLDGAVGAAGLSSVPLNDRDEDDNSISDLNDLLETAPSDDRNGIRDDDDDPYGDADGAEEEHPPPRARTNRGGSTAAQRERRRGGGRERRRSSAVALEKHDSLILSELASLMDEMDDDDLESALSESVASMGMGGLGIDADTDADEDAAIAATAEDAAAYALGDGDGARAGASGMMHRLGERSHSDFGVARRDSDASDAISAGGLAGPPRRPQRRASLSSATPRERRGSAARRSLHESLGNILLHRDYRSANLTVSRSDNRRPSYSRRGSGYSSGYRRRSSGFSRGSIGSSIGEDEDDEEEEEETDAGGVAFHQSTGMLVDGSRSMRRISLTSHREHPVEAVDEADEMAFDESDYDWNVQPGAAGITASAGDGASRSFTGGGGNRSTGDATPRGGGILRRSSVQSMHSSSSHHSHSHYVVDPSGVQSTVNVQVALRRSSQVSFLGSGGHSDDEDDDEDGPFNSRGEGNTGRRGYGAAA